MKESFRSALRSTLSGVAIVASLGMTILAYPTTAITATESAPVISRESWRTENDSAYNLQYNVQYYENGDIELQFTTREIVKYDKIESMGAVQFDDKYYSMDFTNVDGSNVKAIALVPQYIDKGIEYEFIKNIQSSNWNAGTTFVIKFFKVDNAVGDAEIIAFDHKLVNIQNTSVPTAEERIAKLETELEVKNELLQIARDKLTQLQQELDIKNQIIADQTATKPSDTADVNNDGVVNVLDLLTLKRLLLNVTAINSDTTN